MAKKKSQEATKQSAAPTLTAPEDIQWPAISVKDDLECREIISDQIYIIDVSIFVSFRHAQPTT
jgi:hypothetical protein